MEIKAFAFTLTILYQPRIFIEFPALIIRSKFYVYLQEEMERLDTRPDYMTVPAAIRKLEVRMLDGDYRLDHALNATQKVIFNSFGIDTKYVKHQAAIFTSILKNK